MGLTEWEESVFAAVLTCFCSQGQRLVRGKVRQLPRMLCLSTDALLLNTKLLADVS